MAETSEGRHSDTMPEAPAGVSAFVAKVLDQLSLSAWLPAALLTAALTLLTQFRSQQTVELTQALTAITGDPWRVVILALPVLVIATIVTQAFSFEAIRSLEGYWRRRGPTGWLRTAMIWLQGRRKMSLGRRRQKAAEDAFAVARIRLLKRKVPRAVVDALEAQVLDVEPPRLSPEEQDLFEKMNWRSDCDAWQLSRVDHLVMAERDYPISTRVLPTRLGNVLRATEDKLLHGRGDLEGFAMRRRELASARVQMQHDQFRTRMDMYCTLVFVCGALTVLTPLMLVGRSIGAWPIAIICGGFVALGLTSYQAAIASARGYCAVLRQFDRADQA